MSLSISTSLSAQDSTALMRAMTRQSRALNRSLAFGVKGAAWAVADSLRTATKTSDKVRPVVELGKPPRRRKGEPAPMRRFKIKALRKNKRKFWEVEAPTKTQAKKHRYAQIGNAGLARKAWHWAQGELGSRRGGRKVNGRTLSLAEQYSKVAKRLRGVDPFVKIENRLPYAMDAFKTSGEQTLSNVMQRAARKMELFTERQLEKKWGAR